MGVIILDKKKVNNKGQIIAYQREIQTLVSKLSNNSILVRLDQDAKIIFFQPDIDRYKDPDIVSAIEKLIVKKPELVDRVDFEIKAA